MARMSACLAVFLSLTGALVCSAGGLPDLVIAMDRAHYISIEPQPKYGVQTGNVLHTYRSYRVTVLVSNFGAKTNACFTVRTQCVRGNDVYTLGEGRIGMSSGSVAYAVYDIFPSLAGTGACLLRTVVDADNEVQELSEGATKHPTMPIQLDQTHTTKATIMK